MFEFVYMLFHNRRFLFVGIVVIADLFLLSILATTAQTKHVSAAAKPGVIAEPTHTYDSPNVVTNAFLMANDDVSNAVNSVTSTLYDGVASIGTGAAQVGSEVGNGAHDVATFATHGVKGGFGAITKATGHGGVFFGRTIVGGSMIFIGRDVIVGSYVAEWHALTAGAVFTGHTVASTFDTVSHVTNVASFIKPAETDTTPMPTITELRIQQAAVIQKDTKKVVIDSLTHSVGGACDAGDGNGGYPIAWCNASMDTLKTVSYSNDAINRECTSYAFWYFTHIEGYNDFHVTGNAKEWAATSNYLTHVIPAVGAIAVETAGAYGHVAIVQALPGQTYAGRKVPAGNVLVSEMNYDWNGHFRYSFSPLGKFSAFIYP